MRQLTTLEIRIIAMAAEHFADAAEAHQGELRSRNEFCRQSYGRQELVSLRLARALVRALGTA